MDCILVSMYMCMASDDVQKSGGHCLREGKRCAPEDKNLSFASFLEMRSEHLLRTKHVALLSNRPYIFTSHHYNHNEKLHDRCQSGQTPFNIGYQTGSFR